MNTKPTSFDRLRLLRDWLRLKFPKIKEAAIERKMGVATNYFKTRERAPIAKGNKGIRSQTIENVKEAWSTQPPDTPQLNIDWLITGQGEMFLEKQIIDPTKGIPYYNDDFMQSERIDKILLTEPNYYISLPTYNRSGVLCITITGSSMCPTINSGDKIILELTRIENIIFGEIYAIITDNDMRTIRRVVRADDNEMIRLMPDNRDHQYGDYQDIPKAEIKTIFKVICLLRAF